MFIFKRNQVIITALVFMVTIAAYLNFTDKQNAVQPTFDDDGEKITDASLEDGMDSDIFSTYEFDSIDTLPPDFDGVDAEVAEGESNLVTSLQDRMITENSKAQSESKTEENIDEDEVVLVNKTHDVDYFVEAKMDREQKRAEQIEMLSECISSDTLDKDSKSGAATNLITLQERIEKESAIESLLKAKGFKEVFVRISDDDVDVVINREDIEEADVAQIEDIVRRKTGYSTSQIKISPLKG